ncbi:hypothetical protein PILCRDRAFT_821688 [Piloderma croceum F 1598]|uniref:Uncharacterized protein n=1 Tax=Piloderma croceum (strain F 1598) TaxID=765440 RepID=A0A0C3B4V4_PILCF|nr:hypothetical protein PILCRDRAFT_821688 [Piloderma croceum F 1598]
MTRRVLVPAIGCCSVACLAKNPEGYGSWIRISRVKAIMLTTGLRISNEYATLDDGRGIG